MQEKKYGETLAALKKQDRSFKMDYKDFKSVPAYAGFVQSPQHQEWLQYLSRKASQRDEEPGRARTRTQKAGSGA